jgi:hypothetical protein
MGDLVQERFYEGVDDLVEFLAIRIGVWNDPSI